MSTELTVEYMLDYLRKQADALARRSQKAIARNPYEPQVQSPEEALESCIEHFESLQPLYSLKNPSPANESFIDRFMNRVVITESKKNK